MRVNFRHGIINYQLPSFLLINRTSIDLIVDTTPLLFTIASGHKDYLCVESNYIKNAWTALVPNVDQWIYIDYDTRTAKRTFGITRFQPVIGSTAPHTPVTDQHWFDTNANQMKVWTGVFWSPKIRIVLANIQRGVVPISISDQSPHFSGSQIGDNSSVLAGTILFNNDTGAPLTDNSGQFITTEDNLRTDNTNTSVVKFANTLIETAADQNMAAYTFVTFSDFGHIIHANSFTASLDAPYGMILEDVTVGNVAYVVTSGIISTNQWDWSSVGINAPLYCDDAGALSTIPVIPEQIYSALVLDKNTILLGPPRQIFSGGSAPVILNPMTDTKLGIARLSVPAASGTDPIVVGTNDPRLTSSLQIAGGTMTGNLFLNADPTGPLQAATKHYVDTLPTQLHLLGDVQITNVHTGQILSYDGTSWVNVNNAALTSLPDVIVAGTTTKVTYNTKGLITATSSLSPNDIPNLPWTKITNTPTTIAGYGITDALSLSLANLTYAPIGQTLTFVGDVIGSGQLTSNIQLTLIPSGVTAGTYNNLAGDVVPFTVNSKGLITAIGTPIPITILFSSIQNKPTTLAGYGITDAINVNTLGVANGVATLDSSGQLDPSQIPTSLIGDVNYQGTWNASTNTPTLATGIGTKGYYYRVSVAGTTSIDGISVWFPGDMIVYEGTQWQKIDGVVNEVSSVNSVNPVAGNIALTFTGDVTSTAGSSVLTLVTSGVTAGTYNSVTVNTKGIVTGATNVAPTPSTITLSGDVTGTGTTGATPIIVTLDTVNSSVGVFGSGSTIPVITTNGKGLITNVSTQQVILPTIFTNTSFITGNGTSGTPLTLAVSGVTAGTYNSSATQVTPFTVDLEGRVIATGTNVTITPQFASIANKPTTLAGYGITDAINVNQLGVASGVATLDSTSHITASQLPAYTGDVTKPTGSTVLTLATVNTNVGTFNNLTVNGKGLVTAASNVAYLTSVPTASTSVLGLVKIDGTTVTISGAGVISAPYTYTLPTASASVLGGIVVGSGLSITGGGLLSANPYTLPTASTTVLGGVKVDGTTITINGSGVISGANTYVLPVATSSVLGGVKQGTGVTIAADGTISTNVIPSQLASTTQVGEVQVGYGLNITGAGLLTTSDTVYSVNGSGSNDGCQARDRVIFGTTVGNTSTSLLLGGSGGTKLILSNNSSWSYEILIVATRTDGTVGNATWKYMGNIFRHASAASTVLTPGVLVEIISQTDATWNNPTSNITIGADTTSGALTVDVSGFLGATIQWAAYVKTVEISF